MLVTVAAAACAAGSASRAAGDGEPRERRARPGAVGDDADHRAAVDAGIHARALPCVADRDCMTHRCDRERKRCRFPCRSDDDCNPGARCDVEGGPLAACFSP